MQSIKNEWTYHENEELEPVQPVQMNIYQSNTAYRKHLIWIHFDSEPSVQVRHQVRGGQPYISVSVIYLKYPRSSQEHQPRHGNNVLHKVLW